ncbi:MAG: CAP domain-containing protein [Methylococcales bacterium]|nr:CAP domain-containing protein [Methylococcales bacterium]
MKVLLIFIFLAFFSACTPSDNQKIKTTKTVIKIEKSNSTDALNESERLALLKAHNKIRKDANLKPLSWSTEMAQEAQVWAKNLAQTGCTLQHNKHSNYGENLFMGALKHYKVIDAIKSWEKEKADYKGNFLNSENWRKVGHYTQIVWQSTTELGCAKAICNHHLIVVCHYNPAGNYMGQKPY